MIKASACAKTILAGEHGVVYGAKALAIPVHSLRAEVSIRDTNEVDMQSFMSRGDDISKHHELISSALDRAKKLLNFQGNIDIETSTSIPLGAGLGSSAALSVALIRGLSQKLGLSLTTENLSAHALELEKIFHGSPSGLDTTVVSYEKPILFEKGPKFEFIDVQRSKRMYFALIDTNERSSTKSMIEAAKPYFTGSKLSSTIDEFDKITAMALEAITEANSEKIKDSFERSTFQLDRAGVITPKMKEIMNSLGDLGIYSKPTGAGGGGMILAHLPSHDYASLLNELRQSHSDDNVFLAEC